VPVILVTWEAKIRSMAVSGQSGRDNWRDLISSTTRAEWTEGVAQGVECLLCKTEALSSNPSATKKTKKKSKQIPWPFKIFKNYLFIFFIIGL
jgi:hypothetical protein